MYSVGTPPSSTGISPATLRKWERRYDVVEPGAQRGRLPALRRRGGRPAAGDGALVAAGWSPALAAARVLAHDGAAPGPDARRSERPATLGDLDAPRPGSPRTSTRSPSTRCSTTASRRRPRGRRRRLADAGPAPPRRRLARRASRRGRRALRQRRRAAAARRGVWTRRRPARGPPGRSSAWRAARATSSACWPSPPLLRRAASTWSTSAGTCRARPGWLGPATVPDAVVIGVPIADDVPAVRETVDGARRGAARRARLPRRAPPGPHRRPGPARPRARGGGAPVSPTCGWAGQSNSSLSQLSLRFLGRRVGLAGRSAGRVAGWSLRW